jgi:diguanylate cyclase
VNQVPDWREKYRALTEQFDAQARTWKQLEDILRRLVRRLCAAAQGIDARLDEELGVVATTIRTAASADALEQLLSRVTTAVTAFDATRALTGQHRESQAASATAATAPAAAPGAVPPAPVPPALAPAGPVAPGAATPAPGLPVDGTAGFEALAEPLLLVLDRLGLVASDKSEADAVRSGLSEPSSMAAFEQAVWRLGDLIAAERGRLETEKAESERVLKQVSARLGEIASFLAASQADQGEADRSGRELNDRLRGEVQEIGSTVQVATNLGDLQVAVKSRLEAIDGHLQAFRAREERRSYAYRERAERMGERIQQLENETAALERSLLREQRMAMLDALTGIANRLGYDERIEQEFKRWRRFRQPLSIIAWDLDRFKTINDSYGHRAGDRVLRAFAKLLREKVRETDFVARYGGEEFIMLLIGTPTEAARGVAALIREEIDRLGFHFRGTPVKVTASCGITEIRVDDTPETLFDRADRALYRAKEAGRDRSEVD